MLTEVIFTQYRQKDPYKLQSLFSRINNIFANFTIKLSSIHQKIMNSVIELRNSKQIEQFNRKKKVT